MPYGDSFSYTALLRSSLSIGLATINYFLTRTISAALKIFLKRKMANKAKHKIGF